MDGRAMTRKTRGGVGELEASMHAEPEEFSLCGQSMQPVWGRGRTVSSGDRCMGLNPSPQHFLDMQCTASVSLPVPL